MKNCPHCNQRPISFGAWCNGINSLSCNCAYCGAKLKANAVTWICIALTVIAMVAVVVAGIVIFGLSIRTDQLKLILLVSLPVIAGCFIGYHFGGYSATAALLTRAEFARLYVQSLLARYPQAKIQVNDELGLAINLDGFEVNTHLGNAYSAYSSGTRLLDVVVNEQLNSFEAIVQPEKNKTKEHIFPVVRSAEFMAASKQQLIDAGFAQGDLPFCYEPINDDLFLLYVLDSETGMQYLNHDGLKEFGIQREQLAQMGSEYLKMHFAHHNAHLQSIDTQQGKLYRFRVDGNYDASVLVFPEKIAEITNSIGDTPVFFIPARDMVLIAGKQDSAALEIAAHLAQSGYNELAYSISPHGYVFEDGVCKRYC
ncbi:DUF1444 family protein [Cellvibrio sp. UBA7661]|uniref:DUF1444 family protein n=1 Tax=Cellvibrio sp. UBA7661 TaxID=1946311 RepID=UPI002F35B94A